MKKSTLLYGFSIFSMFFGSGNLVFPLKLGVENHNLWNIAFLGLFITGVILPFLGLFVIKLHKGNYNTFFGEAGKTAQLLLPFFILSLLGSFGVVPRCITVAHGSISYIVPQVSLSVFSALFLAICYFACLKEQWIIALLGKWLTPILLVALLFLITIGVSQAPDFQGSYEFNITNIRESFTRGFLEGYETMDLFAAFFFSSLIFKQIQDSMKKEKNNEEMILKIALKSSLIGATLLSIIYLGFVFLGAHYKSIVIESAPELILPKLAYYLLGNKATLLITVIVMLSCITTAVALNNIYARYILEVARIKESYFAIILLVTTIVSFIISTFDFRGITKFLVPILHASYPALIILTLLSIITTKYPMLKKLLFYGVVIVSIAYRYY